MTNDDEYREFLEWKRFKAWREAHADEPIPPAPERQPAKAAEPTVRELWEKYVAWGPTSPDGWSESHVYHGVAILQQLGDLPWSAVTLAKWDDFRGWLSKAPTQYGVGYAPSSRNAYLCSLKACLNWAVSRDHIPKNPLARARYERVPETRDFHITPEEFARLLEAARPQFRLMAIVAFETGLRHTELRELEKEWVDLHRAQIVLPADETKGRYKRIIPLSDAALSALKAAIDHGRPYGTRYVFANTYPRSAGRPLNKRTVQTWMEEARARAGIKGPKGQPVWIHTLRKTWASLNAMDGMPIPALMEIAGWRSHEVMRKYVQMNPKHIADARAFLNRRGTIHLVPQLEAEPLKRTK